MTILSQLIHLSRIYSGFTISDVKDANVSFKLDKSLKSKLVSLAKSENRTLSNYIEKVLKEEVARRESRPARAKVE